MIGLMHITKIGGKNLNINIRLNKNFTTQYNKLQEEFGTDIARINGFDEAHGVYF